MKFALVDDIRTTAKPRLSGVCIGCGSVVIPKCGPRRRHHWAHKSKQDCNYLREPETDWHRAWKDEFPEDWQEVVQFNEETGEKHIADIQTDHGWTLEVQNSAISEDEKESRNDFYPNLVWVVNALKMKKAHSQLLEVKAVARKIVSHRLFDVYWSRGLYQDYRRRDQWFNNKSVIAFDYGDKEKDAEDNTNWLWVLLPDDSHQFLVPLRESYFIRLIREGRLSSFIELVRQEIAISPEKLDSW